MAETHQNQIVASEPQAMVGEIRARVRGAAVVAGWKSTPDWQNAIDYARAAIEAMREPTQKQMDAGFVALDYDDSPFDEAADFNNKRVCGAVFTAMIDAALE